MPHLRDDAVCIRRWDFSETSQTVSLLTRSHGTLRAIAKGAKRTGGRFSGGIDLLTRGQAVAIVKAGRELSTLTDWTLTGTWRCLRTNLAANRAGWYLADLAQRMLLPGEPHQRVFHAMVTGLDAMEASCAPAAAILRYQWILLDDGGWRPQLDAPADAARLAFRASEGRVVSEPRAADWRVRSQTVDALRLLAEDARVARLAALSALPPATLDGANRLLAAYIRQILQVEPAAMRLCFPTLSRSDAPS